MRVEPGQPIYDSPEPDGDISKAANRGVVSLLAVLVAVMVAVVAFGGSDSPTEPTTTTTQTTDFVATPDTDGATENDDEAGDPDQEPQTTSTTIVDEPANIDPDWTAESVGWFIDGERRLVRVDLTSGLVERFDVAMSQIDGMHLVGDHVLLVGSPASFLVSPDASSIRQVAGVPAAWDDQVVWSMSSSADGALRFTALRPGQDAQTLLGSSGYANAVHAAGGSLFVDGPTGVWRFDPEGDIDEVSDLVVAARGNTVVAWQCELNQCQLVADFGDGQPRPLPRTAIDAGFSISSTGRFILGGRRPVGWLVESGVSGDSTVDLGVPLRWMEGRDLLVGASEGELTFSSPDRSESYESEIPADLRSDLVLVVAEP